MFRWPTLVGIVLGLLLGFAILGGAEAIRWQASSTGPVLSECDGHLSELVMHFDPEASETVGAVYRQFVSELGEDITVHVVCSNEPAFDDFKTLVGKVRCRLNPVIVRHPITTWSRDRWVCLESKRGGRMTLLGPREETAQEVWPARAGDQRVFEDLATTTGVLAQACRSDLYFDGGDFMATGEDVFVVGRVMARNIQHTAHSRTELLDRLHSILHRRVILLDPAPDHHAGMFMAAAGNRTVLVGDPSLGYITPEAANALPGGPDLKPETQRLFDAVASQVAQAGYRVERIPVALSPDGRTYLTYCNVIIDQQQDRRIVYLPFYRGVDELNTAARSVWEKLGYEVRPIDCTEVYRHFGCLHCLVNVLRRE